MTLSILSPIHRALRQITLSLETRISDKGYRFSADEGHALSYIAAYGPCPTGDIQRVLGLRRSTLTSLLNRLADRDLITRQPAPKDGRVILVTCTADGVSTAQEIEKEAIQLEQAIRADLDPNDLQAFNRVMAAIATATGVQVVDHNSPRNAS